MKKLIIILLSLYAVNSFAQADSWNKHLFKLTPESIQQLKEKGMVYPSKYYMYIVTPLTKDKLISTELSNMIFVQGGVLRQRNGEKIKVSSYYINKYLTPYYLYNSYLNELNKYFPSEDDEMSPERNGDYPIKAGFKRAHNYCQWLAKETGLPFKLPTMAQWHNGTMAQWLYAATSGGKNWNYPTNNGKLEIGKNYPNLLLEKSLETANLVTGLPINSLGIHQFFGNGLQWTSSTLTDKNQAEFKVFVREREDYNFNKIVAGTPYHWDKNDIESVNLSSFDYIQSGNPNIDLKTMGGAAFRCVINTDKPLPKA